MQHQLAFIDIVSLSLRRSPRRTPRYAYVGSSLPPHSIFECKLVSNCTKSFACARLLASLFLLLVLVSCGYTIVKEKGIFQGEVVAVDVPVFKNRSLEPQVSQFFTEAFTRELVTSGLFDVNKPDAPNTLQGSIASVRIVPTALDKNGLAIEKTVYVTADFALSKKDGRAIKSWSLGDAEPYRVDDVNLEDANKKAALTKIASRIARRFSVLVIADIDRKAL